MARLLVAEDEEGVREFLVEALELAGHTLTAARDGHEAQRLLRERSFELLLTDLKMPGPSGLDLLREVRASQPELQVILLTAHGTVDTAVEAMKLGAFDYLQKPVGSPAELRLVVERALEHRALADSQERSERLREGQVRLTWGAPAMSQVVDALQKVAPTQATVLLTGESGAGKDVVARALHERSPRAAGPFVAVNCAALSESLLESELFGHEKGAFTGASARRRGRLELAEGGTFFLDEVAELKPELQAKLLRVLQDRRFERIGGSQTIEADVRWVAATNRDLRARVDEGAFREDLYHRLAVFPIHVPPLRERLEDLPQLAAELLARIGQRLGRPSLTIHPDALKVLSRQAWRGNIRELANVLERGAILAGGETLGPDDLVLETPRPGSGRPLTPSGARSLEEMEQEAIKAALGEADGNRRQAAKLLGIGERTLYDKLRKYGIK